MLSSPLIDSKTTPSLPTMSSTMSSTTPSVPPPLPPPSAAAAAPSFAAAAAAVAAKVVTPVIDEFEQESFLASASTFIAISASADRGPGPILPSFEGVVEAAAALPRQKFSREYASPDGRILPSDSLDGLESLDSLASLTVDAAVQAAAGDHTSDEEFPEGSPGASRHVRPQFVQVLLEEEPDVAEAADLLLRFKDDAARAAKYGAPEEEADVIDLACEMMAEESPRDDDADGGGEIQIRPHCWEAMEAEDVEAVEDDFSAATANDASRPGESLLHPDRLAHEDDKEEVNQLHRYVRSHLLEVFVVPHQDSKAASNGSEEDEEGASSPSADSGSSDQAERVTRRRAVPVKTAYATPAATAIRHYPGRVGLRCVHCAHVRRRPSSSSSSRSSSTSSAKGAAKASKAAFYPLRLKNIYREVCAWQRIHFKKCRHVPPGVRERYDHYKRIDTSRGKVRYWEMSAKKIGVSDNTEREDGIAFGTTAWRA
ncbi:hypothetical protein ACHAWF_010278 [Thalassiosira exigua]